MSAYSAVPAVAPVRIAKVSFTIPAGPRVAMNALQVQIDYLVYDPTQRTAITELYNDSGQTCHVFAKGNQLDQQRAQAILKELGLDRNTRNHLESHWKVQWSNSWSVGSGSMKDERRHILFQW